jgi:hypothetical protein
MFEGVRSPAWPTSGEKRMEHLVVAIGALAESISALARGTEKEYAPIVDSIVRAHSQDIRHIERTLERLLHFCFDPGVLLLFKKLCRYYFSIDPVATSKYISIYRDMCDCETEEQT